MGCITQTRKENEMDPLPPKAGKKIPHRSVRLPVALLAEVEAVYEARGYTTMTDYIRTAIRKQLAEDAGRTEGKT
jgi:metal-responsive CopG/Arc/MetJ family transcriptional regulator